MKYTVRFAHLKSMTVLKDVKEGDFIGKMGTTGQSKHNHLHIDVIEGHVSGIVRLKEIGKGKEFPYKPCEKQLNFFNDAALFKIEPVTTTPYMSKEYKKKFGKDHPALDLVPKDRHDTEDHFNIYWNRTKPGTVLKTGNDKGGYGNYVLVGFEA